LRYCNKPEISEIYTSVDSSCQPTLMCVFRHSRPINIDWYKIFDNRTFNLIDRQRVYSRHVDEVTMVSILIPTVPLVPKYKCGVGNVYATIGLKRIVNCTSGNKFSVSGLNIVIIITVILSLFVFVSIVTLVIRQRIRLNAQSFPQLPPVPIYDQPIYDHSSMPNYDQVLSRQQQDVIPTMISISQVPPPPPMFTLPEVAARDPMFRLNQAEIPQDEISVFDEPYATYVPLSAFVSEGEYK